MFMGTELLLGVWQIGLIVIAHNTKDRLNVAPAPIWEGWGRRLVWSGSQAGILHTASVMVNS